MEFKKFSMFLDAKIIRLIILTSLLVSARYALACAGGDDCFNLECRSVFDPELLVQESGLSPFFLSTRQFYVPQNNYSFSMRPTSSKSIKQLNTDEWVSFLGGKINGTLLEKLVYELPLPELDELIFALRDKKKPKSEKAAEIYPELLKLDDQALVKHALFYLGFAKRVEPGAIKNLDSDSWSSPENGKTDSPAFVDPDKMIAAAENSLSSITDKFLIARYRFQILRIYFYSKRVAEVVKYYDSHVSDFVGTSSIEYRSLEFAAGALYRSKNYARANYLYSIIFDRFPALRPEATFAFHPQEETDWNETLKLSKSPREKSILWLLLGITADGARAIEKIVEINPHFDFLPLLVVREVNKAEQSIDIYSFSKQATAPKRVKPIQVNEASINILRHSLENNKIDKPGLWALSLAHLFILKNDETNFLKYLAIAKSNDLKTDAFKSQIRMTEFFGRLKFLQSPPEKDAQYFATELTWLLPSKNDRMRTLSDWGQKYLSYLYNKKGDWVRKFAWSDISSDPLYRDNSKVEKLLTLITNKPIGPQAPLDAIVKNFYPSSKSDLHKIQAINLTYVDNLKEVFAIYKNDTILGSQGLGANPFKERINDCHDCDFEELKGKSLYTRLSFVKKLIDLEKLGENSGEKAAISNSELGTAFYNLTYYGNSRDYSRTKESNIPERSFSGALALKYYNQAFLKSSNPELKAKVTFMLAKVNHNKFYDDLFAQNIDLFSSPLPITTDPQFKLLKDKFSGTKYYQEILNECGYLGNYVMAKESPATKKVEKK